MTSLFSSLLALAVFVASAVATRLQRRFALRSGLMDLPNERSSHTQPTPRSGGVAIAATALAGFATAWSAGGIDDELFFALVGGGAPIAVVGYLDDRFSLSALLRFFVHIAASVWLLWCLGGVPPLSFGATSVDLGLTGDVLGVAAIVWVINLFNFMDGIDGLAASEAIFVSLAAPALLVANAMSAGVTPAALIFAAACAGFLLSNWPPAKIFMGDVGSGFVGFTIAGLALGALRVEPAAGVLFLILGAVFFVDATTTLVRRLLRGEHFYQAHRIHAYQWLARRFGSHLRVVIGVIVVNVVWLLPCGWLAVRSPDLRGAALLLALVPLLLAALAAGAGRREKK